MLATIPPAAYLAIAIGGALLLDSLIGDPAFAWHPVRLLGRLAAAGEKLGRRLFAAPEKDSQPDPAATDRAARRLKLAGAACWLAVCAIAYAFSAGVSALLGSLHPAAGLAGDIIIIWASIAPADLARHANRVRRALRRDRLDGSGEPHRARAALAMIVGRDVSRLDAAGCARAAAESVAESSVDGVAAPLFWAALFGPAAAFVYRAINTMDSMFGHHNERYENFGLVPARADDVANFFPARLSAVLACLVAPLAGGSLPAALRCLALNRLKHASPNAGHPEAAYAGAFGLRLGGPTHYAEGLADKPWLNAGGGECREAHIGQAIRLMYAQSLASGVAFLALRYGLDLLA
ncbi:MAG: hypothetical protein A2087_14465 [Spirochaetes bacterium GWD1_61_31]|nr:MAG: hypothetical protein A2Y37_11075 [Spirochaetes bacterium GWB1_60_80]OHD35354.1 MAG: hypothetical protein A2004_00310 [Spirochaetes bacterium GWC1_61_12]OHD37310.1 MAG: hypothetical protein A2087_14465 [Spirochaetes bacterium GWD1_61_31]OHD45028.1 MAG: hypothetical protein A2Y35_13120 [Spirochaetes bacterium GWE1_60_18]OHD60140.1 MAG: hypothetical protein A2Y32_11230 [Spirochaetes bacterium GWF1_60_12]